jgi:hypothetical protein
VAARSLKCLRKPQRPLPPGSGDYPMTRCETRECRRMAEPSGKIVARPMVTRACGHPQEFQHYEVDKYRAQRLAKFQRTRCAQCVAKLTEEQRRAAEALPTKGEALKSLPPGTQVSLTRQPDGCWAGTLFADGTTVEVPGVAGAGPQSALVALARLWVSEAGAGRQ